MVRIIFTPKSVETNGSLPLKTKKSRGECAPAPAPAPAPAGGADDEIKFALDGKAYTKAEFQLYYKKDADKIWAEACPSYETLAYWWRSWVPYESGKAELDNREQAAPNVKQASPITQENPPVIGCIQS